MKNTMKMEHNMTEDITKIEYTEEEREMINNGLFAGAPEHVKMQGWYMARYFNIDLRLPNVITMQKFRNQSGGYDYSFITGIGTMIGLAHRLGMLSLKHDILYAGNDPNGTPILDTVTITTKDGGEYVNPTRFRDFNTNRGMWASKPLVMLKKVATAACIREAFPIMALYDSSEFSMARQEAREEALADKEAGIAEAEKTYAASPALTKSRKEREAEAVPNPKPVTESEKASQKDFETIIKPKETSTKVKEEKPSEVPLNADKNGKVKECTLEEAQHYIELIGMRKKDADMCDIVDKAKIGVKKGWFNESYLNAVLLEVS